MLEAAVSMAKLPKERHHYNVDRYGNTASAGSASVRLQRWDDWEAGDDVASWE